MKNRKIKLLLIQPHSDDILFSCSYFLLHTDEYEVEVLTIENNPTRITEDRKLFEFLNIPFHHLDADFDDQSYYGYHKKHKEVTVEESIIWLREFFGNSVLVDVKSKLRKFLYDFFKTHKDYTIVAPWGIGHPFHIFVRDLLEDMKFSMWYYREFPHSYKRRSKLQVEKQQSDYEIIKRFPVKDFYDVKWAIAKKFYKSQSSLLFFESGHIKKQYDEEIYILKNQRNA